MTMSRIGGYAGLLAAALFVLTVVLSFAAGTLPSFDDPAATIASYYADNSGTIELLGLFGVLTLFILPLFFVAWFVRIRQSERDGNEWWSILALVGFIATGAVVGAQSAVQLTLVWGIGKDLGTSGPLVTALFDAYNGLGAGLSALFAVTLVGLAMAQKGRGLVAEWTTPLLQLGVVLALVSLLAPFTETDFLALLGFGAFIVFIIWVAVASAALLRGAPAARAAGPVP